MSGIETRRERAIDIRADRKVEQGRALLNMKKHQKVLGMMLDGLTDQFITKLTIGYGAQRICIETTPADLRRSFAVLAYQGGAPD